MKYTELQKQELEKNKYVKKINERNITFTKECKIEAVKLWNTGYTSREVFKKLGFPEYIIRSDIPEKSVNRWKRKIEEKGIENIEQKKGRIKKERIDTSKMTKDEYIEYLEAKLAIVEELKKFDKGEYP